MIKKNYSNNRNIVPNSIVWYFNITLNYQFSSLKSKKIITTKKIKKKIKKILLLIYKDYKRVDIVEYLTEEEKKKDIIHGKIIQLYSIVFPDIFPGTNSAEETTTIKNVDSDEIMDLDSDEIMDLDSDEIMDLDSDEIMDLDSDEIMDLDSDEILNLNSEKPIGYYYRNVVTYEPKDVKSYNIIKTETKDEINLEKIDTKTENTELRSLDSIKKYIDFSEDQKLTEEDLKDLDERLEKLGLTKKDDELEEELDKKKLIIFGEEFSEEEFYNFFNPTIEIFEPLLEHPLIGYIKTNFYLIDHTLLKNLNDIVDLIYAINSKYTDKSIYAVRVYEFPAEDASLAFTTLDIAVQRIEADPYWKEVLYTINYDPNRSKFTDIYSVAYKDKRHSSDTNKLSGISMSPQFETILMEIWSNNKNITNWRKSWPVIYILHFYTPDMFSKAPLEFEELFDPY